ELESYFGYDISNYTDVHPLFGTLADMDTLLHQAHRQRTVLPGCPQPLGSGTSCETARTGTRSRCPLDVYGSRRITRSVRVPAARDEGYLIILGSKDQSKFETISYEDSASRRTG